MKGLEYKALEKLCEIATYKGGNDIEIRVSNYNSVIFKALKELYERREMMRRFNEACVPMILDNETEKKLKALEIIANKKVNVFTLLQCCYDIGKYNAKCSKLQSMLTLDEVNLLKKVLL